MTWLTEEQLIYLHDELIRATGGSQGLRDKNLLQSALYSPLQTFDSSELFPTIQQKVARLACGLTQNHPFVDGNKRIGAHAMLVVLELNGIQLHYTQRELADTFLQLAASEIGYDELLAWLTSHIRGLLHSINKL